LKHSREPLPGEIEEHNVYTSGIASSSSQVIGSKTAATKTIVFLFMEEKTGKIQSLKSCLKKKNI